MTTIESEYARLKALADAANWKSYKEHCTCGGYAFPMNGRDPDDPHLPYCPQRPEFMALKAARGSLVKSCQDMMALIERLMEERRNAKFNVRCDYENQHVKASMYMDVVRSETEDDGSTTVVVRDAGPSEFGGRKTRRDP